MKYPVFKVHRWHYAFLCGLLVCFPALASTLLVFYHFDCSWAAFQPVWSDEVMYWREISSFVDFGLSGGYNTVEEFLPPIVIGNAGTHGPFFTFTYGLLGKIFGWAKESAPLFNIGALTLALALFIGIVRPTITQLTSILALAVTFWPTFLYVPSLMQESLQQSMAILMAGLYIKTFTNDKPSPLLWATILSATFFAALLRPTWGFVLPALAIAHQQWPYGKNRWLRIVFSAVCVTILFLLYALWTAPYPGGFLYQFFKLLQNNQVQALHMFKRHFFSNLSLFSDISRSQILELVVRHAAAALVIITAFLSCKGPQEQRHHYLFVSLQLGATLVFVLLFYDLCEWRDFRIIVPHLLTGLLIIALLQKHKIILLITGAFALTLPHFLITFHNLHAPHFQKQVPPPLDLSQIAPYTNFDETRGPWGNSLLTDIQDYRLVLPSGIGIGIVIDWARVPLPIRSRYILISPGANRKLEGKGNFILLTTSPLGVLYLNQY